jgi:RimJ/RimL family protein N-acetyltransferase
MLNPAAATTRGSFAAMILFETERLIAPRLLAEDAEAMAAIYGDVEAMRYVGDGEPLSVEGCRHWVEVTDRNFASRGYGMVAFVARDSDEIVGCGGIVHPGQQPEAEVKYAFRRDQWGRGYATEAVGALLAYARNSWHVGRVIATTHPENGPSHHVLTKLGFTRLADRVNEDSSTTAVWERVPTGEPAP